LSIRNFLGLELHEAPPDHSTVRAQEEPEIQGTGVQRHTFENVVVPAQMRAAHPAGFVETKESTATTCGSDVLAPAVHHGGNVSPSGGSAPQGQSISATRAGRGTIQSSAWRG
jgi:hypothetical protein